MQKINKKKHKIENKMKKKWSNNQSKESHKIKQKGKSIWVTDFTDKLKKQNT